MKKVITFLVIFIILVAFCCFLEDEVGFNFYGFDRDSIIFIPKTENKQRAENATKTSPEKKVDTLHISLSSIYLISSGGTIDADCDNGCKIVIESQDNQNFNSYSRLTYQFDSKDEYLEALDYINQKGARWILGHQFEKEYSWNSPHQITFEKRNNSNITVNNMWLNHISK